MTETIDKYIRDVIAGSAMIMPVVVRDCIRSGCNASIKMAAHSCTCYSSCGSNFSLEKKCSCYSSCGSNFSKRQKCVCYSGCGSNYSME